MGKVAIDLTLKGITTWVLSYATSATRFSATATSDFVLPETNP